MVGGGQSAPPKATLRLPVLAEVRIFQAKHA
jgi:hypothetical protein